MQLYFRYNPNQQIERMDSLVSKIAALGVPGLVLLIAMSATGYAGAAALTTALAALGGPLGMLGGLAALGLLGLISKGIADYGFEAIYKRVVKELRKQGVTQEEVIEKIEGYPISRNLKLKLKEVVQEQGV